MLDIFGKIFEILFPIHPSAQLLKNETPERFVRLFSPHFIADCYTLSSYNHPVVRSAINANKFHNNNHAGKLLATLLQTWLNTLPNKPTIFVPIPLSSTRERERGYNQVTKVINLMTTNEKILVKNLLVRIKDTKPQTRLTREQRLINLIDVFEYKNANLEFSNYRVILIDDVITTGTTMRYAYNVLKKHLPKECEIICVAFSH